jgi:hypothetical protein
MLLLCRLHALREAVSATGASPSQRLLLVLSSVRGATGAPVAGARTATSKHTLCESRPLPCRGCWIACCPCTAAPVGTARPSPLHTRMPGPCHPPAEPDTRDPCPAGRPAGVRRHCATAARAGAACRVRGPPFASKGAHRRAGSGVGAWLGLWPGRGDDVVQPPAAAGGAGQAVRGAAVDAGPEWGSGQVRLVAVAQGLHRRP